MDANLRNNFGLLAIAVVLIMIVGFCSALFFDLGLAKGEIRAMNMYECSAVRGIENDQ